MEIQATFLMGLLELEQNVAKYENLYKTSALD